MYLFIRSFFVKLKINECFLAQAKSTRSLFLNSGCVETSSSNFCLVVIVYFLSYILMKTLKMNNMEEDRTHSCLLKKMDQIKDEAELGSSHTK